jgi:hypothetical protein
VELILARPVDSDRDQLALALRRELGAARIPLRLTQPDAPGWPTAESFAGAIRGAVGRGAAGLIVEPREEPAAIDALYEAVDRGVAVLLLDRPVPARGGKTIPRVEYTSFLDAGRQVVGAALEAGRSLGRVGPGRVVILHHRSDDPYLDRSLESLLAPCREAGRPARVLTFEGDAERGLAALRESLKAEPGMDILFVDDTYGMFAGYHLHREWPGADRRGFLLAGYASADVRTLEVLTRAYAFGDRSVDSYALEASRAIRSLLDGRPVGDVIGVPVTFRRQAEIPPTGPIEAVSPVKRRVQSSAAPPPNKG